MASKLPSILLILFFFLSACEQRFTSSEKKLGEKITFKDMEMVRADSSEIPPDVRQRYKLDSELITALRTNSQDSTQIKLSSELIDVLYNGFLHIYNSDIKEANDITREMEIHRDVQSGASRQLYLRIDKEQEWARAWLDDILVTGNTGIDRLIEKYNLHLTEARELFTEPDISAQFKSEKPYNHFALADLFEERDDVENAGANINIIDGDNIEVSLAEDHIQYLFSKGFGDCFAGCIGRHFWSFEVFSDGRVEFIEEYGDPLP